MENARFTHARQAGLLMPVSSLPNRHGIGDFGLETYAFLKDVKKAGFSLWQILPLTPIGYGHSPYQPFASSAMDEIYISLDLLVKKGWLKTQSLLTPLSQEGKIFFSPAAAGLRV